MLILVYGFRLGCPAEPYFDEVHYVKFIRGLLYAHQYLETANVHPPLWHFLTAFVVNWLGDYALAWRMVSLVAGLLIFIPLYLIAKRLTGSQSVALLSVFFLAFDCISLTQARIAMMNSLMLLWGLFSSYYFLEAFPEAGRIKRKALLLSGVFLGLASATKLVMLNLYLFFIPILVMELFKQKPAGRFTFPDLILFLVVIPIMIFIGVHLFIPALTDRSFIDIGRIWKFHMNYNLTTDQTHTYNSKWLGWTLMLRPIWFYFKTWDWGQSSAMVSGIICIGNPAVLWLIPVAVYNLLLNFFFKKSWAAGLVLLGFFTQWLSYAFMQRFQFFHYFYSAMPFAVMAIAYLVKQLWNWGAFWRSVVIMYLLLVAGMFVYWYPLLIGLPVSGSFYSHHIWFKSWI